MDKVRYIDIPRFHDERGFFNETLNLSKQHFTELGEYKQSNFSLNKKNVLRGMHYQLDNPQGKLVQVISGAVYDFVIDLRKSSDTYMRLDTFYLSGARTNALWVPPGYAHGFLSLKDDTILHYHAFDNNWVKGDEYHINPLEVHGIHAFLSKLLDLNELILSGKDAVSSKPEAAAKYE